MKKLLFLCSFFLLAGVVSLSAQSAKKCAKSCSKTAAKECSKADAKSCMKTASAEALQHVNPQALAVADTDESISYQECSKSGKVSFMKSYTCEESGKLVSKKVEYNAKLNAFVDIKEELKGIEELTPKVNQ